MAVVNVVFDIRDCLAILATAASKHVEQQEVKFADYQFYEKSEKMNNK